MGNPFGGIGKYAFHAYSQKHFCSSLICIPRSRFPKRHFSWINRLITASKKRLQGYIDHFQLPYRWGHPAKSKLLPHHYWKMLWGLRFVPYATHFCAICSKSSNFLNQHVIYGHQRDQYNKSDKLTCFNDEIMEPMALLWYMKGHLG